MTNDQSKIMLGRLWNCLGVCRSKSVIILGVPRTGSSLLATYVESLNGFKNYGEILNPQIYSSLNKIVSFPLKKKVALIRIKWILSASNDITVIKLLAGHLNKFTIKLEDLNQNFPLTKFIMIYRSSLIDCYVSFLRAKQTQAWSSRKSSSNNEPISLTVNKDEFINFCHKTKQDYFHYNTTGLLDRSLVIQYAQLVEQPQNLFQDKICPFLETPYHPIQSSLKKQIQTPLAQLVTNWYEIQDIINSPLAVLQFNTKTRVFY
ncbi:MAG: hypothetical protein AB4372_34675 [Xenococcus sp. (in: cyanobacteria)]